MSEDIKIVPAEDQKALNDFVAVPFRILGHCPLWIPPIRKQDAELLTPGAHPFWQTARRQLFLAERDGNVVGRIAAIVDDKYNDYAGEKCGAFGFFDCANDRQAAHALLDAARTWLAAQGMTFMRGPLNPSANYACGLLVGGFSLAPAIMMPWNPPYYAELLEGWLLRKEQDLYAYKFEKDRLELPQWLKDEIQRIRNANAFTFRASSRKTMEADIHAMLEIYRLSWADNWGFSPLSPGEAARHVKELKDFLDPDFFVLFFHKGEPAAGMVALPDLTPLLKRLNGKLGISALWHFWRSRAQTRKGLRVMLFGILPQCRLLGLPLLLLDYMLEKARRKKDLEWVEGSWVLEDNVAIDDLLEDFGGRLVKRYRIYRREIGPC